MKKKFYGDVHVTEIFRKAAEIFNPSALHPSADGGIRLCLLGEPDTWTTSGYDEAEGGWVAHHPDGRVCIWNTELVFDPYDAVHIGAFLETGVLMMGAHQDKKAHLARISKAASELKPEPEP